jgi:hypothetical protein
MQNIEQFLLDNAETLAPFLEEKDHISLAKVLGRELCDFTEDDEKYVDIFWDAAFNKSWIYLSDEIITDWAGYKKNTSSIAKFHTIMKNKYIIDVDYKEVTKTHPLVESYRKSCLPDQVGKHNKKYYIITGETLKKMLLRANTKNGELVCDYYIKTETLASVTTQLLYKYAEAQIKKLESRQLRLESLVKNIQTLEKTQIFYLATSTSYAAQNRFKYGGVKDARELKNRLNTYNTGRAEGDLFYYCKLFKCNKYKVIEESIGAVLGQFRDKTDSQKELLHIRYDSLTDVVDFMCVNYNKSVDYVNAHCQTFLQQIVDGESIIPEAVDLETACMEITIHNGGRKTKTEKIDVSGWTDEEINTAIEEIINKFARDRNIIYNCAEDKNTTSLELKWMDLDTYMAPYKLSKTAWREKFKNWFAQTQPEKLKIKGIKLP